MVGSRSYFKSALHSTLVTGGIALLVMGCDDRNSVKVYQAPKESAQQPMDAAAQGDNSAGSPDAPALPQFVLPEGWVQVQPGPMQNAAFAVDAGDPQLTVGLSNFGKISPVLSNVTRWEGQLGLPQSTADDLAKVVTHTQNNGLEIDSVDLRAPLPPGQTDGRRIVASIISNSNQQWFLKFDALASKVDAHKSQYDAFLKSIALAQAPAVATPTAVTPAPVQTAGASSIAAFSSYTTPAGWVLDPQERPMRLATFHIADGGQSADVILTMLSAQFGTPEANFTRWRGEVGLGPVDDASKVPRSPVKVGGVDGLLFDFISADPNAPDAKQAVVAEVIKDDHSFFFKLIGSAKLVEQQKKSFDAFLQSVQFASNQP